VVRNGSWQVLTELSLDKKHYLRKGVYWAHTIRSSQHEEKVIDKKHSDKHDDSYSVVAGMGTSSDCQRDRPQGSSSGRVGPSRSLHRSTDGSDVSRPPAILPSLTDEARCTLFSRVTDDRTCEV
jgi:hypothetical protein